MLRGSQNPGVYNALNRTAEYELVPVLRNYGIKYYTHGSLASGFLTGCPI